jgi:hypothetical protein
MTKDDLYKLIVTVGPAKAALYGAFDGEGGSGNSLLSWAYANTFRLVSATRDDNGAIITASIVWPDDVTGTFTTDVASTAFPGAIDAWHATYGGQTVTQLAVTRDNNGAVIAQPAITITGGV